MTMEVRKASREKAKLRLGISAPTGAGKTFSSLLIASGLSQKVALIDTENGSGDLYAEDPDILKVLPNGYQIITLNAPFEPRRYIEAIETLENLGIEVIIIDSLSHAWVGSGGSLDKQGKEADRTGNSYVAWRKVTPDHNSLVDKLLQSSSHIIATMRAKTEYVQEKNQDGKTIVRKLGMSPMMRDGVEFEFSVFGEMDQDNFFKASKDRTRVLRDTYMKPTKEMGIKLLNWLNSGIEEAPKLDLKKWAKDFADEIKAAETQDDLKHLMVGARVNLALLEHELPAYWQRLKELELSMDISLANVAKDKDINDDLHKLLSDVTLKQLNELEEALAIPQALKRVK